MDSRKPRVARLPGLLLAAMLLLTLASLPASGESQYQLIVFTEKGEDYQIGDTVRLEIHFFDRENYADAAEINLSARYGGPYIEVDEAAARKATGVYDVSFVLAEEHVPYGFLSLDITAYAVAGSDNPDDRAQDNMWLWPREPEVTDFDIAMEADPLEPRPGDTVTFTVSFYNFSTPVDPPEEDIEAELEAFEGWETVNLTRQSTGVYTYSYTVPADQKQGGLIELDVEADYDDHRAYGSSSSLLRFYDYWIHTLEFTDSSYQGAVYISDMDGQAVAGADVHFQYVYDDGANWEERWSNGTSDATGKLDLNLPLPNFVERDGFDIYIEVNGTYYDEINGGLDYSEEEGFVPSEPYVGFDVVSQQEEWGLDPDTDVTLTYRAYKDSVPLANHDLYIYLVNRDYDFTAPTADPATAVQHEKVLTDATGNFFLPFRTPVDCDGQIRLHFKAFLPGVEWDGTNYTISYGDPRVSCNNFQEDPSIVIQTTNFGIGQRATITATKAVTDEAWAFFEVAPVGDRTSFDPEEDIVELEWQRLPGGFPGLGVYQKFSGNRVAVEFLLPEFLPAENYLVMVVIFTEDDDIYMNYVILDSTGIQVTPTRPPDPDPDPDFVLKELTWEPSSAKAGTTITLRARVANTVPGSGDHAVPVAFYVGDTSLALETATFSGEGEVVVEATWTAKAGNHQLRAVVDPGEVFDEQDETNNQASQSLTISPRVDDDDSILPGPGLLLAGVALLAVAVRRRR